MASLALSLGMVETMGERGGRLKCMFLDEGLGSLDRQALDDAVEAAERERPAGPQDRRDHARPGHRCRSERARLPGQRGGGVPGAPARGEPRGDRVGARDRRPVRGTGPGQPEPRAGSPGRRRRGRTAQDAAGDSLARRARARGDGMDGPGRRAPSCAHGRPSTPRTGRTARPTRCSCWPGGRHYRYRAVQMPNEPASDVWAISPPKGWRRTRAFSEEIPRRCLLLAGTERGTPVVDPFAGTGTTLVAARKDRPRGPRPGTGRATPNQTRESGR